jgi:hypothetical protein
MIMNFLKVRETNLQKCKYFYNTVWIYGTEIKVMPRFLCGCVMGAFHFKVQFLYDAEVTDHFFSIFGYFYLIQMKRSAKER